MITSEDPEDCGTRRSLSFWWWFFHGCGDKPGYRHVLTWQWLIHVPIGTALAFLVTKPLDEVSNSVLLPLAGVLIGLAFAWGGNAQGLMQTAEIQRLSKELPGGLREYAGYYQSAILLILLTVTFWGVAGLSVFETLPKCYPAIYKAIGAALFFMTSLTLVECWGVVDSARLLLLARADIAEADERMAATGSNGEKG